VLVDVSGRALGGVDPETQFLSTTAVHFAALADADTHIDLIADQVLSATLDGVNLTPEAFTGEQLHFQAAAGEHDLIVTAVCRYSRTGEGLHRFVDPIDGQTYLYTQQEPADSRRVFAVFEQPDLKATWQFSVIAPTAWTVFSNAPTPEPQPVGEHCHRFDFGCTQRISPYLTAIVAGPFHTVADSYAGKGGEIELYLACRRTLAPYLDAEALFNTTKRGFAVYEKCFGVPYPFTDYVQAFVPEFNAGAMENAGCVTYRDEYLFRSKMPHSSYESRDNTILHEMAHMWFGDLVTMRWWDDLWLNESFAEWASHFCQAKIREVFGTGDDPWATFTNNRKNWAYRQDQLPSTHPIAADMVDLEAVELNFDGITYAKGASTLRQLVAYVGEAAFLAGVREYFEKHAWGNTELTDLLVELEAASGRSLARFTTDWLQSPGVNTLWAEFDVDPSGNFTAFTIHQEPDPRFATLRQHRLAVGLYDTQADGKLALAQRVELDIDGPATAVPELVGQPQPALILLNDGDLTYAKIRLDARSFATATAQLRQIESTLARALIWGAAWDMCRDAQLPAADYMELVLANIADESDSTAVSTCLNQAITAIDYYAPRETRLALRERFANATYALLMRAAPGSDHQLAFARAFISTDASPEGALLLQRWLFDSDLASLVFYFDTPAYVRLAPELRDGLTPAGLAVDADLRWRIVTALARRGVFAEAEIDAEQHIDPTAQGAELAAGARAARPDAAAKAEAWERLVTAADTPNETHYQIANHFFSFGQDDVLEAYLPRYRAVVEAISSGTEGWDVRSSAIRQHIVGLLFPRPLMDTARYADWKAWLESSPHSPFVTRALSERLDDVARALRAQAA
jgi:aminopeptidase N